MKQTEIGMIPDDWEVKELREVCTTSSGGTPSRNNKQNYIGNIKWFTTSELKDCYLYDSNEHISLSALSNSSAKLFPPETILIAMYGATIGKLGILKVEAATNQACCGIFCKNINLYFLYHYLKFNRNNIVSQGSGAGQPNISQNTVKKLQIPLPPTLAEQQKIAKALSDVDNVISTLEKLITKKKNLKQGTMQQLLTGKKRLPGFGPAVVEPVETTKFKQTEIGEIPEDWEVVNIQEVLVSSKDKLKIGPFGSQLKKEYLLETGLYKVFGQENIYSNNFDYCYRFLTREHFQNLQSCELKEGDFVISTMGTIGKCAVVPENAGIGIMDSHLVRLRLNQNIDKDYFKYYFQSNIIQNQIKALSVGGIMDGLSTSIIKKLDVIKFSKPEQTAIANVLSSMDKEIEALEAKLGKYRNLKTGMMQQLLTGKIRLR